MFDKKLKFDLENLNNNAEKLDTIIGDLENIQKALQSAMDTLVSDSGWSSDGSSAFSERYESSWTEGINDRKAIMERMRDHLRQAIKEYEPIKEEAEKLRIIKE